MEIDQLRPVYNLTLADHCIMLHHIGNRNSVYPNVVQRND